MITPRRTRLLRAPDLATFQTSLVGLIGSLAPRDARDTFVLVPTTAAAEQLRRTVEDRLLRPERPALILPMIGPRSAWYAELAARLSPPPRMLNPFEREVILSAEARAVADEGIAPPFALRPGLVAEMLALYDLVRRLGRTVADFDRNLGGELARDRESDRGAEQLFQQTMFLTAVFGRYEARLAALDACDEHRLRDRLTRLPEDESSSYERPLRHVMVTVGDRIAEPDGLWTADFDLLTRLPDLASIDIVSTESVLGAGLLERLQGVLPEIEEVRPASSGSQAPVLVTPGERGGREIAADVFTYRDREEELIAVARRLKLERHADESAPLHRTALIVRRPLPYLYLARDVFAGAGVPFEAVDTLPLAAEPYAAALDLVLDAVSTDFSRAALVALLRSPHFRLNGEEELPLASIAALDAVLSESRYLGDLARLEAIVAECVSIDEPGSREERRRKLAAPAAAVVIAAVRPLLPLKSEAPMVQQLELLVGWLRRYGAPPDGDRAVVSRGLRVRAAVLGALWSLADAYHRHDPGTVGDVNSVAAAIRRWLGSQTFAASEGSSGVQLLDAQAARYGEFDDVQLLGLIDGEWPERVRRNVLYPSFLLAQLEPLPATPDPGRREREALNAARAAFKDLVLLARRRVRLSSFVLENDAVVEPSVLLDEIDALALARAVAPDAPVRAFAAEALALDPPEPDVVDPLAQRWARARLSEEQPDPSRFRGEAGAWTLPRVSVSRLERYLDCPFRFFSSEVLRLEEQPEDEDTRTPLERGQFLHELFERFFAEWQRRGHRRIDAAALDEARELFTSICEEALRGLPPSEAALERTRLLGSAVSPGIAHRVFAMEAERPVDVVERLLEFPLQGSFVFHARDGRERAVPLNAKTDRIDLLADGTMRVIDYKSKKTPELKIALQLPIYSHCARTVLAGHKGRNWTLGEALYLSFEGPKAVVPFRAKGRTVDELIADAEDRLLNTLDRIAAGQFPAQPSKKSLCGPCPYSTVCRLEYVEAAPAEDHA